MNADPESPEETGAMTHSTARGDGSEAFVDAEEVAP